MSFEKVTIQDCDLYLGDCLEVMSHIQERTIDMVLADPPYETTACEWDAIIPLVPMWKQLKRVAKRNAAIILTAQTPFDKVLGASNLPMLRYEWIWEKTSATGHFNSGKMPMKAHENILVFYDKLPTYHPQKTTGHVRKTAHKRVTLNCDVYGDNTSAANYDSTERYPRSVQLFSSDKQKSNLHPTQKPLSLMEYFIQTYSNPGEVVLDFADGSKTTGVGCVNLGRKYIGIDDKRKFFDIGCERIEKAYQTKPRLFEVVEENKPEQLGLF